VPVNTGLSQSNADTRYSDSIGAELLSIALIGPDEGRRHELAAALAECREAKVREFSTYPRAIDDLPKLLELSFDVILIDLDSDIEFALELVETICAKDSATVMVYSTLADQDLVVRCMRAGAREYLIPPFDRNTVAEALVRASAITRPKARVTKKSTGKSLVFLGAKGGSGVTTIACNFAIALAQETSQSTLLIDLALPMGDAALNLGIAAEYSTDNALQDPERLDASFLHHLLAKHQSGVSLLAAPSKVPEVDASKEAIDKLMAVARQEFDNVIVDAGSRIDLMNTSLFRDASIIYLVTQAGISELRNSNRLISRFFAEGGPKLEVVINRYEPGFLGVTEEVITKAISRPVRWKIPDDYDATRQMQNSASGPSLSDSPISRLILEMASSVTGLPVPPERKKGFSFKGLGRSAGDKGAPTEKAGAALSVVPSSPSPSPTPSPSTATNQGIPASVSWDPPEPIAYGTRLNSNQLNAEASVPGKFVYAPGPGYLLPSGTHSLWVTFNPTDAPEDAAVQASVPITVTKATPVIQWPAPSDMPCGSALSATQLNAAASVAGTFEYAPSAGEVLASGTHTLSATFTPKDSANYTMAEASVSVTVAQTVPDIDWPEPEPITYGTPLSATQLNAEASAPGAFEYAPAPGEILAAGTHSLTVTFVPADGAKYARAHASVPLTVTRATPSITWPAPEKITYGTMLDHDRLCASASVPGSFSYTPGLGAVLAAGEHTPSAVFTPDNLADYTPAQAAVSLTVARAIPAIAWHAPESINCATPLSAKQLNASAAVPGTFVYTPAVGDTLAPGAHTLSVTFTPADGVNYTTAQATVLLSVSEITPSQTAWSAPAAITYGTPLSEAQLNAAALVPGSFVYAPAAGDVLPPGKHKLLAIFTPEDTDRYAKAQVVVTLIVEGLPNVASLMKAAMPSAPSQPANARQSVPAAERKVATVSSMPAPKVQRETRTYKGAIYEKGDDGQWHLQQK
jgi:Flp pilus assembly CpaE family ATPase